MNNSYRKKESLIPNPAPPQRARHIWKILEYLKTNQKKTRFLMGLQMSLKDTVNTPIVVSNTSETVDSEDEPTQGLNLLFEAANILDDILD